MELNRNRTAVQKAQTVVVDKIAEALIEYAKSLGLYVNERAEQALYEAAERLA